MKRMLLFLTLAATMMACTKDDDQDAEIASLTEQLNQLKTDLAELSAQLSTLSSTNSTLNTKVNSLESELDALTSTVTSLQASNATLTTDTTTMGATITALSAQITALAREIAALKGEPYDAATAPTAAADMVMSIFSDSYTDVAGTEFNPNWGQSTVVTTEDLGGNAVLKYASLNYQGTQFAAALDVSEYTSLHIDYFTPDATALDFFLISSGPVEKAKALPVTSKGEWNSIDIPLSDFSPVVLSDLIQFKVAGNGTVYFDNIYFKKVAVAANPLAGTWKMTPVAGSLAVGPQKGSAEWWSIDAAGVTTRACYYDDQYVFGTDGSFSNVMGDQTWVEGWQGGAAPGCATPVAPHNGATATYTYNATTGELVINGSGAFIGLAKAVNGGELATQQDTRSSVPIPSSLTYEVTVVDASNITVHINIGGGYWNYKLTKE
jgi:peptidoglycan hydrolase CwlO-like protein